MMNWRAVVGVVLGAVALFALLSGALAFGIGVGVAASIALYSATSVRAARRTEQGSLAFDLLMDPLGTVIDEATERGMDRIEEKLDRKKGVSEVSSPAPFDADAALERYMAKRETAKPRIGFGRRGLPG